MIAPARRAFNPDLRALPGSSPGPHPKIDFDRMANVLPGVRGATRALGMSWRLADGYAEIFRSLGITHELTINPALHARPVTDAELAELMTRLVRKATCKLRNVSRRQTMNIRARDPNSLVVAGFIEPRTKTGMLQPHFHGGVALRDGEEASFRDLLWAHVGEDAKNRLGPLAPSRTAHPLLILPGSRPTFDLQKMTTASNFIRYANKQAHNGDYPFITTLDLLD